MSNAAFHLVGKYAILVPSDNGQIDISQRSKFGKIVRVDNDDFTVNGVTVLDLTTALRSQIPNLPDIDLRGFSGGLVSGQYGFFVPYFNGVRFSGKLVRINLKTFSEVQVLDLTQVDDSIRGFTAAVVSTIHNDLDTSLWNYTIEDGTQASYTFIT